MYSKQITIKFWSALSVPSLSEKSASALYKTCEAKFGEVNPESIKKLSVSDISETRNGSNRIGDKDAQLIFESLRSDRVSRLLDPTIYDPWCSYDYEPEDDDTGVSLTQLAESLGSQNFVMTGGSEFGDRNSLSKILESKGWNSQSGVTSATTLVICNDPNDGSSKLKKAQSLGIKIVTYNDLFTK